MSAMIDTGLSATITWLGVVTDRKAALEAQPVEAMMLRFTGPEGEAHGGLTRPACSRVKALYPRGRVIRNTRQLSILSAEDLVAIATAMGLPDLDPGLVGASMVLSGLPDFTHLPPASRLLAESGASLVVDMENRACVLPARPIEQRHPGFGARFKRAAAGRRGITAWVEAEGRVRPDDRLRLFIPDQPAWAGAGTPAA